MPDNAERVAVDWYQIADKLAACMAGYLRFHNDDWRQAVESALEDFLAAEEQHNDG